MRQEHVDEAGLGTETGEERQVDIESDTRLAPRLNGNSSDRRGTPTLFIAESL
jgi:hypothetical protein